MESAAPGVSNREGLALDAHTLCEAFQRTAATHAEKVALRSVGGPLELTWAQYAARVRALAAGLAAYGVRSGDTVALMLTNRPEAYLLDTAALHLGATPFSIYNTSSPEQIKYLLGHAECKVILTESQFLQSVLEVLPGLPALQEVFALDGTLDGARPFSDIERKADPSFDFESSWRACSPEDVVTLIYTSGTTGPPKAVELTHENVLWDLRLLDELIPAEPASRLMSYLPMAHAVDRCGCHYSAMTSGATVTTVPDVRQAVAALPEVRPTGWVGVPRIWEKLKAALEAGFQAEPDERRRHQIAQALELSLAAVRAEQAGEPLSEELREACARADAEIWAKVRVALGLDQATRLISGAAPISHEVLEFFAALGMPICEGWGMTEVTAVATMNPRDAIRIGTVGRAIPGVEVALAPDGELLVRGPTVMRGYRKDPERTAETIDGEGWLHTGDIGEIDAEGYVRIVDRKKELIINAAGKNMSPSNIESRLKAASQLIGIAVAIGDRRPYNTALIVLEPEATAAFAAAHGIEATSLAVLAREPSVLEEVRAGVERANRQLSRVEQIKRHTILPLEWEPGGEELTPTMKLRRRPIAARYAAEIDAMYERPAEARV